MERADLRLEITHLFADSTNITKVLLTELSLILLDDMSGGVFAGIIELGVNAAHLIIQFILGIFGCSSGSFKTVRAALPRCGATLLLLTHAHIVLRCW